MAVIKAAQKRPKADSLKEADKSPEGEPRSRVEVPKNLDNAHRLVKQTHKALAAGKVNTSKGFVEKRWDLASTVEQPFRVMVSPGQLNRALRILDAIVKGVVERGGRFERGPESWRLRLFMRKQPVEFYMREAMKRHDRHFTEEEREARGFWMRDKYDAMQKLREWRQDADLNSAITDYVATVKRLPDTATLQERINFYLPKDHELGGVEKVRDSGGEIEVFTPAELRQLFAACLTPVQERGKWRDRETMIPHLARFEHAKTTAQARKPPLLRFARSGPFHA